MYLGLEIKKSKQRNVYGYFRTRNIKPLYGNNIKYTINDNYFMDLIVEDFVGFLKSSYRVYK